MEGTKEMVASDALRVDRDIGHIELGIVDSRTFEVVSASNRFYTWINRNPAQRVSLCEIISGVTSQSIQTALSQNQGVCELEGRFISTKRQPVTLRIRLIRTGKSDVSPLRLLAFDISELRRKEEILRTVSGYLEAHKNIISESRKTLKSLLDSLPQAVFMLDRDLRITSETSRMAIELFGADFSQRSFLELTGLNADDFEPLELAFAGVPWDLMGGVLPSEFTRGDKIFALRFIPLFEQQMLIAITVIVDDVTEQRKLQRTLKQTDSDNRALVAILSSRNEFHDLVNLVHKADGVIDNLAELRPIIHSLKGGFSFFDCDSFAARCHALEEELNPVVYTPDVGKRFVADLSRDMTAFLGRYSELLRVTSGVSAQELGKTSVQVAYDAIGEVYRKAQATSADPAVLAAIEKLAEVSLSSTLVWLDKAWMKTLLKEEKEGRNISFESDVQIAREPYKELFQTFVHIVRNAVAHGIEAPEERVFLNKNRAGSMRISSSFQNETYSISFRDDGVGINPDDVLAMARARGMKIDDNLSKEEIFLLLCEPEVSSKLQVTQLSGRGLGLDAVRRAAKACGGDVKIESELGVGTTVTVWFKRQPYW
jgi:two-component system chemotaxis sensor kinase CheA